jgi:hypothetical protein
MTKILLTAEQMKALPRASAPVEVCDQSGRVLGAFVPNLSADVVATIRLTEEQKSLLVETLSPVEICDPQGVVLATAEPEQFPEFIAEMKRRASAPGPRYTGEQVRRHLAALEEAWQREGPFDKKRMFEILEQVRSADKPCLGRSMDNQNPALESSF